MSAEDRIGHSNKEVHTEPKSIQELQESIRALFRLDKSTQQTALSPLITAILKGGIVTKATVQGLANPDWEKLLADAAHQVIDTNYEVTGDEGITQRKLWKGGFTLVALSEEGTILAGVDNPVGYAYENGADLYKMALTKAVLRMFLYHQGKKGGLGKPENMQFLKQNAGTTHLYMGDSKTRPIYTREQQPLRIAIGASGAEVKDDYLFTRLFPVQEEKTREQWNHDIFAGAVDQTFAKQVRKCLEQSELPLVQPEPKRFASMAIKH